MFDDLNQIFQEFFTNISQMLPKILSAIVVLIVFYVLGRVFNRVIGGRIERLWRDNILSRFLAEVGKWSLYMMGVIIALNFIGFGGIASSLLAGAGVSAIIVGFAFKDIGENFLAGILLALNRPFEVGDIIDVGGYKGTIKDLDIRTTHIRTGDGRDVYIPNATIVKNPLVNYTIDGNLRTSFVIGIAPESDIDNVRSLIIGYLYQKEHVLNDPRPNVIVKELGEFTVDMEVMFWFDVLANKEFADAHLGNAIRSKVITDVKVLLDDHGVSMPSQVLEHKMYGDAQLRVEQ